MNVDVLEARYLTGYTLWLRFRDGTCGEIDLEPALRGPAFAPLLDLDYFKRFRVDPDFHTLVWPNDVDIAPEYLHENLRVTA